MQVQHRMHAPSHPDCELRLGVASWNDPEAGSTFLKSAKFTWFNKLGHACRGGELPIEALVDLLAFALAKGFIAEADLETLRLRKVDSAL